MKKSILLILMFIAIFFAEGSQVYAFSCKIGDNDCTISSIENLPFEYPKLVRTHPVCIYKVTQDNNKSYYNYIFIGDDNTLYGGTTMPNANAHAKSGIITPDFSKSDIAYISSDAYEKLVNNGMCPSNSYIDENGLKEVCFDNGINDKSNASCEHSGSKFSETKTSTLEKDYEYVFKYKDVSYRETCDFSNQQGEYKSCRYDSSSATGNDIILYYNNNNSFISMYHSDFENRFVVSSNIKFAFETAYTQSYQAYTTFNNNIPNSISSCPEELYLYESGTGIITTEAKGYRLLTTPESDTDDDLEIFELTPCVNETKPIPEEPVDCEGLISGTLRDYIIGVLDIIKIGVPILLIGLVIYDFATAVFAGDDNKVSKAKNRAIKRVIIAVIIFFVPTLINFVFDLVNEIWGTKFEICETIETK